jgi:uncharacterized protein YqeY
VLQAYLPQRLSAEEITATVAALVAQIEARPPPAPATWAR